MDIQKKTDKILFFVFFVETQNQLISFQISVFFPTIYGCLHLPVYRHHLLLTHYKQMILMHLSNCMQRQTDTHAPDSIMYQYPIDRLLFCGFVIAASRQMDGTMMTV